MKLKNFLSSTASLFAFQDLKPNFKTHPGSTPTRRKAPLRIDRFADELPYAQFEESDKLCVIAAPDGSFEGLGFVIEVTPQTGTSLNMAKSLEHMIGSILPDGTGVQVSLFGSPFIEPLVELVRSQTLRPTPEDTPARAEQKDLLSAMTQAKAKFLSRSATQAPHPALPILGRNLRCWISVVIPTKDPFTSEARDNALLVRKVMVSTLNQWHFAPFVWDERILVHTLSLILNPQLFVNGAWSFSEVDTAREPRAQMVSHETTISVEEDGIVFRSANHPLTVKAVSLSPHAYPQSFSLDKMARAAGDVEGSLGFSSPFLITTYLSKTSYEKGKSYAQLKSARAEQMSATEIARFIPTLQEEARDWRAAVQSFEHGEGLVQLSHQVLIFPTTENVTHEVQTTIGIFKKMSIELMQDHLMHLQGLMASLPMTGGPLLAHDVKLAKRSSTKTSANAANTMPLLGDWKGSGTRAGHLLPTPILSLFSRRGQITHIDPFANPHGNYNGIVTGSSGSGKSVMLNSLALGTLCSNGRVWVIDIGRSYEKLCHCVNGQWIELSDTPRPDGKIDCLNPLSVTKNIEADMDLVLPLIAQMASSNEQLDDLMLSHLQIHIRHIWYEAKALNKVPTITDLTRSLLHNGRLGGAHPRLNDPEWEAYYASLTTEEQKTLDDPRLVDLGVKLMPYAQGGAYASFFDGEANIDFDNHFIVLELEQLNTKKSLQAVVLMLLMYLIDVEMRRGERSQPKLVIIDEAWDLMVRGHSSKFIEAGYRRARKLNGAFFTGTQGPGDYWKSSAAKAALDNADCKFIMKLKESVLSECEKESQLGLDDYEFQQLRSLKGLRDVYSEVLVKIGDAPTSVNRLILDPFSLLVMSTHPKDISDINRFRKEGLSMRKAIEAVLLERGQGEFIP